MGVTRKQTVILAMCLLAMLFASTVTLAAKKSKQQRMMYLAHLTVEQMAPSVDMYILYYKPPRQPLDKIQKLLESKHVGLNKNVALRTLATLSCAKKYKLIHGNILTVIDYSLPSNQKRIWVFDLAKSKLLYHTYVSHGIKSGTKLSTNFSNIYNSKATSLGIYNTGRSYRGRHGFSLKLRGLEKGFNDNAYKRFIVMHGSWYVNESFIKKYGRAGRSWGCPSLPRDLTKPIIETIKGQNLMVVYYPRSKWLKKSKYLNCNALLNQKINHDLNTLQKPNPEDLKPRKNILFADKNKNSRRERNEPIIVVSADDYQQIFNNKPPLKRMLRRQINNAEYIALSNKEFESIYKNKKHHLKSVNFIIPVVSKLRGFYATEMKILDFGRIKSVSSSISNSKNGTVMRYTITFTKKSPMRFRTSRSFIRWLGL